MKPELMGYIMFNYPNPAGYWQMATAMLQAKIPYIEVQMPFTNPVADGQTLYEAHQKAVIFPLEIALEIEKLAKLRDEISPNTKLVLMSYLTPMLAFGLEKMMLLLKENGFISLLIPDLMAGTPEQIMLSEKCRENGLEWMPLISPQTSLIRLNKIKNYLQKGQIVYAMARKGQTGEISDFETEQMQEYLSFLKNNLSDYKILMGFGIQNKRQLDYLNQQGFLVVIASEFIKRVETEMLNNTGNPQIAKVVTSYLQELGFYLSGDYKFIKN